MSLAVRAGRLLCARETDGREFLAPASRRDLHGFDHQETPQEDAEAQTQETLEEDALAAPPEVVARRAELWGDSERGPLSIAGPRGEGALRIFTDFGDGGILPAVTLSFRFLTFLTDYGLEDEFVGVCHGVIKRFAPDVQIIDISHGIPP